MNFVTKGALCAMSLMLVAPAANAAIVVGADVGALGTFTDTDTGLNWLRLDNFFNQSTNTMRAIAEANGFAFANKSAVETLLDDLPLPSADLWDDYAAIMGQTPARDLIWGAYIPPTQDVNPSYGVAYAYRGFRGWAFLDLALYGDTIPNPGTSAADVNLWAYREIVGASAPEPASWALMILGFGASGAIFRGRRKVAAAA